MSIEERINQIVDLTFYGEKHYLRDCYNYRRDWLRKSLYDLVNWAKEEKILHDSIHERNIHDDR